MFDSPFEFCAVVKQYVALDQTAHDCRRMHRCDAHLTCGVQPLFARHEPAQCAWKTVDGDAAAA